MGITKFFNNLYRKFVFWIGDVRRISHFPFVTWDIKSHNISYEEALSSLKYISTGCIGLHRDIGYLSNIPISGFFKHAFFLKNSLDIGFENMKCIEAISEGVVERHSLYPIVSDFTVILRPKNFTELDINESVNRAISIVGCKYDAHFNFDLETEIALFDVIKDLPDLRENLLRHWDGGFSCTELCYFCLSHKKNELGLIRKPYTCGKRVVVADDFINNNFEIVWCSKNVTPENAKRYGLHLMGIKMIKEYWKNRT